MSGAEDVGKIAEGLKPCPTCGSPARIETFSGSHIDGECRLWICSNHPKFGGTCSHDCAYFDADAWNASYLEESSHG